MSKFPILGFGITGHRSFKGEPQLLGPFKQINIFIGENNAGKSNVLRFIRKIYSPLSQRTPPKTEKIDAVMGVTPPDIYPILVKLEKEVWEQAYRNVHGIFELVQQAFDSRYRQAPFGFFWLDHDRQSGRPAFPEYHQFRKGNDSPVIQLWRTITGSGGGSAQHWYPPIFDKLVELTSRPVHPVFIPTARRIPSNLPMFQDEYGSPGQNDPDLIGQLATFAYPEHTRFKDREKFEKIQNFVRKVLKRPDIKISIQHDKLAINVEDYGRFLPIETLGTGVHQVVLLAVQAVLEENTVICLEEPELHLHPELQHQLMHFLAHETANQYFITTHSATIMDAVDADVYSVKLGSDGFSRVDKPLVRGDRRAICHELGYRPSDLLQANSLVWVEGPSDRIYLLNWLREKAPEFEEGWHFSVVFYGGRLLSNLSVEETALDDFIALLPINRFPAILIDSDKKNRQARINETKTRIEEEFKKLPRAYVWVTKGREIENYLSREIRQKSVKAVHGDQAIILDHDDIYGRPLAFSDDAVKGRLDKLAIARAACGQPLATDLFDLDEKLDGLIKFIRHANRMDTMAS